MLHYTSLEKAADMAAECLIGENMRSRSGFFALIIS